MVIMLTSVIIVSSIVLLNTKSAATDSPIGQESAWTNANSQIQGIHDIRQLEFNTDNATSTDNVMTLIIVTPSPVISIAVMGVSSTPTITPTLTKTPIPTTKIPTPTPTKLIPTPTKTPTPTSVPTNTPTPTITPTFTPTSTPIVIPTTNAVCDYTYTVALFNEINNYRALNGKPAYTLDNTVSIAACNHSYWMKTTGIFSHTGLNNSTPAIRCSWVGTICSGENITMGNESYIQPAAIISRWSVSAPHNENLLGSYKRVGIGRNGSYVTVDFGF